ncbi:MAG: lactate dehydrogenase [Verrucomicrobiales bacterium]|nr:lactate dehydrogenase [Verrucomicrobiales bacterium]
MLLRPQSHQELQESLRSAAQSRQRIEAVSLEHFTRVLEYFPEDLTVTVEAGISLRSLQTELGQKGQWLPLDPPQPGQVTIRSLIEENLSGPRRHGYGTVREHLIGLKAMLPDGRIIKSGGKVVKNVAGYDLQKLFVGSRGSLGIVLEATFKLQPRPEVEEIWQASFDSLQESFRFARQIIDSPVEPTVLDLFQFRSEPYAVVIGFAGPREDVQSQKEVVTSMAKLSASSLVHDERFWAGTEPAWKFSVLPTKLAEVLHKAAPAEFVARVGSGVAWCRGGEAPAKAFLPVHWVQKVKDTFDPQHILPEITL